MDTWYDYRSVWAAHPWVLAYAVVVVLVFVLSIIGTIAGGPLVVLFVPSLAGAYFHHVLVGRRLAHPPGRR